MRHYEVNFIVNPTLSNDEVKATAEHLQKEIKAAGASIVQVNEIGLRQLAYPIKKCSTGFYFCIEFACESAEWLVKFELNMKRNENLLRFLTVKLDKYGVKYNEDKREGRIGSRAKKATAPAPETVAEAPVTQPEVVDLDA